MQLKVKDFAAQMGVSESIIYRHVRQNQEELGDWVIKKPKATWLTDEAQDFIRNLMIQTPPVAVTDVQTAAELAEARKEIERLHKELEAALKEAKELQGVRGLLAAAETERKLLAESRDDFKQQAIDARQDAKEARLEADEQKRIATTAILKNQAIMNRGLLDRIRNREVEGFD